MAVTENERRAKIKKFVEYWTGRGYEKGESQLFWIDLLSSILNVEEPRNFISFEDQVHLDHTSFIDAYIPSTKVLIEQKSLNKDLNKAIKQSDGSLLTPFLQAKRYILDLPVSKHPRWVITCNFAEFYIYDMEKPSGEPVKIKLQDLEKEWYRLEFLTDTGNDNLKREMEISLSAGHIVGLLYDALLKEYKNPESPESLKSLNVLCVRLVFCLYAEDSDVFGKHLMFHDYLQQFSTRQIRKALIELFEVLDTPPEKRDPYLDEALAAFPYVNGGLFSDNNIEIPNFTDELRELLLEKASREIDWSEISPTIFGALFESTLNPITRRSGGMHYTSLENIHKVIDPLFLDDLKAELESIKREGIIGTRTRRLKDFQKELSSLTFLDPACGSGNFLTETYLCLRRMENEVLAILNKEQIRFVFDEDTPVQVSIDQFYGIEINDFAVTVAKTALWIAESQMIKETEDIIKIHLDFLPLKTNAHIVEANALPLDWESVVPKNKLNYIIGNPPFAGKKEQNRVQKTDLLSCFEAKAKGAGNLDYVTGWYMKAAKFMANSKTRTAFLSTNSIAQGEQVAILWCNLFKYNIHIDFAYRTFVWDSESINKASVHCIVIGFSIFENTRRKQLFSNGAMQIVDNINPYLVNGPSILIKSRTKAICDVPALSYGSMPIDDGHLILNSKDKDKLLKEDESNKQFIREYAGGDELIKGKQRWCLWLKDANPKDLKKSSFICERIKAVLEFRSKSTRPQTLALAETPTLFGEIRQPDSNMLVIPKVSSGERKYIPICYKSPDVIINGCALLIPNASLYIFGVLMSNVHMAWTRTVCGRMKSDYVYSANIVYNNFPWPNPTEAQKAKIEKTAKAILEARALYPGNSLADLYDDVTMPPELRKAHQANDRAVMEAYGLSVKDTTESSCVAHLMNLYKKLTETKK